MSRGVVLLPVTAVRLAGRHLAPLTLWFSLGYLARYLLTWAGVAVSHGSHEQLRRVAATLILTALITVTLATVIGMLSAVRDLDGESRVDVVGRALLPFVVIYLAWGMYLADVRAFSRVDIEHNLYGAHDSVAGRALYVTDLWIALVAVAVTWSARLLLDRWRDRRALGPVLAYLETAFNLFAISSVLVLAGRATGWVTGRRIWPAGGALPFQDVAGMAFSTLALPLVWFAMAAVVYGIGTEPDDPRPVFDGTRLHKIGEVGEDHRVVTRLTTGQRERWVPLIHAVRLILRAGAPALGLFCLCYVGVDAAVAYAFRGALHLIGPGHDPAAWKPILVPVEFARELARNALHVALLASAVELVQVSAETGEPEPDPVPA